MFEVRFRNIRPSARMKTPFLGNTGSKWGLSPRRCSPLKRRFFITVITILAAISAGVALAAIPRMERLAVLPQAAEEKELPASSSPASQAEPAGYLLGEYNGRVSVLTPDTREPEMIFDIFVRTLPEMDQELLRQGIRVETYEELTRLIEDYIS